MRFVGCDDPGNAIVRRNCSVLSSLASLVMEILVHIVRMVGVNERNVEERAVKSVTAVRRERRP